MGLISITPTSSPTKSHSETILKPSPAICSSLATRHYWSNFGITGFFSGLARSTGWSASCLRAALSQSSGRLSASLSRCATVPRLNKSSQANQTYQASKVRDASQSRQNLRDIVDILGQLNSAVPHIPFNLDHFQSDRSWRASLYQVIERYTGTLFAITSCIKAARTSE